MIVRLVTRDGTERTFDTVLAAFIDGTAIPCFRCGLCCQRWSPELSAEDADRLAACLSLSTDAFLERYARPYPGGGHVLRHTEEGCLFLTRDTDGRAACAVYNARPNACRAWQASLARRECRDGLALGGQGLLAASSLYPDDPASLAEMVARLKEPPPR